MSCSFGEVAHHLFAVSFKNDTDQWLVTLGHKSFPAVCLPVGHSFIFFVKDCRISLL